MKAESFNAAAAGIGAVIAAIALVLSVRALRLTRRATQASEASAVASETAARAAERSAKAAEESNVMADDRHRQQLIESTYAHVEVDGVLRTSHVIEGSSRKAGYIRIVNFGPAVARNVELSWVNVTVSWRRGKVPNPRTEKLLELAPQEKLFWHNARFSPSPEVQLTWQDGRGTHTVSKVISFHG